MARLPPPWPSRPPTGCDSSRSFGSSRSRSAASGTRTLHAARPGRRCRRTARCAARAGCGARRRAACSPACAMTACVSTSSSTCEPPCRSRPSTIAWCGTSQLGMKHGIDCSMALRVSGDSRLGIARASRARVSSTTPMVFSREKRSIGVCKPAIGPNCGRRPESRPAARSGLDRLALGADLGDHAADDAHADAVGDLDLDLGRRRSPW